MAEDILLSSLPFLFLSTLTRRGIKGPNLKTGQRKRTFSFSLLANWITLNEKRRNGTVTVYQRPVAAGGALHNQRKSRQA